MRHRTLRKKTARDLRERTGRLAALLLVVAAGVGCFVGMAALYRDLSESRANYYRACRFADFTVDLKRAPAHAVGAVRALPNVSAARGRVSAAALIHVPGARQPVSGSAISMPARRQPVINDVILDTGTWFTGADRAETILNNEFARHNGIKPGDRIRVDLLDRSHDVLVVGTAMSPEFTTLIPPGGGLAPDPARFGVMYMPLRFLRAASDQDGAYNQIVGTMHNRSRAAALATLRLAEESLAPYGVLDATPYFNQLSYRFLRDEIEGLRISVVVLPGIFLGVAALGLGLLVSRMVAQQRTVVGTLKALGYGRGAIVFHYLAFGLAVGLAGGVLGGLFGLWIEAQVVKIYRQFFALPGIKAHYYADLLVGGILVSALFALLGALKGAVAAARLAPAVSMRPPPPERGRALLPDAVPWLRRRLSFHWKMVLRAVFRNPWRSAVSVLGALVATSILLSSLSLMDSLDYLIGHHFTKVSHEDMTVSLREPAGREAMFELARLPGVLFVEPKLNLVADIRNGSRRRRVAVTGLARPNRLHTPLDKDGRAIAIPPSGVALSRRLAEVLSAKAGDTVTVQPSLGLRRPARAQVHAIVDTFLGLSAYADIEYLSRLIGEECCADSLLMNVAGGAPSPALVAELARRPAVLGMDQRRRALHQMEEVFGEQMATSLGIVVLFSGLIAFASVLNIALISASEHKRDAAVFRAVGYRPFQVASIFTAESYLLNAVGIVAGLGVGTLLAHALAMAYNTDLYRFPARVDPSRMVLSAMLMLLFVTLGQIVIFRMVNKLDWLEAVKVRE